MSQDRTSVCSLDDLAEGVPSRFEVAGVALCLVRLGDRVYAVEDRCSHENVPLSEGEVDAEERQIECPRHGSRFDLEDGTALSLPAVRAVRTFPVEVEDEGVFVVVDGG